jgi:deoxyribonuclease-4
MTELPTPKDGMVALQAWRIGLHTSISGGLPRALDRAWALRCTALQIFSASPRSWSRDQHSLPDEQVRAFRKRRRELGIRPLVVHANYLMNLAASRPDLYAASIRSLHHELLRAQQIEADYLVVHPGSRGDDALEAAIDRVARAIRRASVGIQNPPRILLENTAGQGSALGARLEELQWLLQAVPPPVIGVCLDTAHLFAAGYDLRSPAGLRDCLEEAEQTIGLTRVPVIHLNDSKAGLGSRRDRHEHLGQGQIGVQGLRRTLRHPRLQHCAFLLETPLEQPGDDWRNMRLAWRLAGVRWTRPRQRTNGFAIRRQRTTRGRP